MPTDAAAAAERAARGSYSRLVAYLAARTGDVAAAEDSVADAFCAVLETWPVSGVPERPDAWLMRVAKNRLIDTARHRTVHSKFASLLSVADDGTAAGESSAGFPDERLKLLFICAHPAIDVAARTPLMLQSVLGIDAVRIASAFLISPSAMSQRLVRAKSKIRDARIPFVVPSDRDLGERVDAVLDAIYVAYGTGWQEAVGTDERNQGLAEEAIWLARLTVSLLADEPRAQGLLALLLYCEARRDARRGGGGEYVPFSSQNTDRWDVSMLREAEVVLTRALRKAGGSRFPLEAAIQSAHVARRLTDRSNWEAVNELYNRLIDIAPSIGSKVGRAAALAEWRGPDAGLDALEMLDAKQIQNHQPYWAVKAELLAQAGRRNEARIAYASVVDRN